MSSGYRQKCLLDKGEECISCGATQGIEVHHLDGDRSNDDIDNLIPLCIRCHSTLHRSGLDGLEEDLLPATERTISYTLDVNGELWEQWKHTVPRSKSLGARIGELIQVDAMAEHTPNTRKTITVSEDAYQAAESVKESDESWGECLVRLAESQDESREHEMNTDTRGVGVGEGVYEEIRKLQELIEQMPATTAEHVRREFEENYRP